MTDKGHIHIQSFVSGAIAGAFAKSAVAPFDRVKILFQVSDIKRFSLGNASTLLKDLYNSEGMPGLWRGNAAMMVRIVPYAAIQFMTFEVYKKKLMQMSDRSSSNLSVMNRFLAGAGAGITSVFATYPLDLMRARFAVHPHYYGLSMIRSFQLMIREEGAISLLRGIVPTVAGIVPYAGVSFCCYESLKHVYLRKIYEKKMNNWIESGRIGVKPEETNKVTLLPRFIFGAIAGAVSQTLSYPLDVVRRRMQIEEVKLTGLRSRATTMTETFKSIYRQDGMNGLFKGVTMNWIKGPIALGLSFAMYDFCKYQFELHNQDNNNDDN